MDHHIVSGIDPGLVHTGIVTLRFETTKKKVFVKHTAVSGCDPHDVQQALGTGRLGYAWHTFIEGYRPRSHYGTDEKMVAAVREIHKALPESKVLLNHGVKRVIRRPLMELLGVYKFSTVTHHQDLRAAARIALFGMVKDEELNELLTQIVWDHGRGAGWDVLS